MDTNVWRRKCIIVMSRVVNNYISLYITDQSPSSWYVRNSNRPTERAKSQALLMYNLCILAETCFSFQNSGPHRELPRDQEIDDRSEAKRSYQYRLWASRGQGIFYYELHLYYQSSIWKIYMFLPLKIIYLFFVVTTAWCSSRGRFEHCGVCSVDISILWVWS